jgi:flagellar protein FliO/FliZ
MVMAIAALLSTMLICRQAAAQTPGAKVETNVSRPAAAAPDAPPATTDSQTPNARTPETTTQGTGEASPVLNPDEDRPIDGQGGTAGDATGDGPGWSMNVLDMIWPLALVLGGIVLLFWAARKFLPGMRRLTGNKAVEILARTYLSPRQSINIVKLGRRILVIGQTADGLSSLASITDAEEVSEIVGLCASAGAGSSAASFRRIFQTMDGEFEEADAPDGDAGDEDLSRVRGELDSLAAKVRRMAGEHKEAP